MPDWTNPLVTLVDGEGQSAGDGELDPEGSEWLSNVVGWKPSKVSRAPSPAVDTGKEKRTLRKELSACIRDAIAPVKTESSVLTG